MTWQPQDINACLMMVNKTTLQANISFYPHFLFSSLYLILLLLINIGFCKKAHLPILAYHFIF